MIDVELVILDCDGVLVNTEPITNALLAEMTTEVGWAVAASESVRRFKGRDLAEIQIEIEQVIERPLGEGFVPEYRRRMAERFQTQRVPAIPGAAALLAALDAADLAHVVASNGPQEKMRMTLGGIGEVDTDDWFERFEGRRFSAYDIGIWKPDPGLFLHAARRMSVAPERCVVIEDSTSGIQAAVAAGMHAIGFVDLTPAETLADAGAHVVCESHEEVASHLGVPWPVASEH